MDTFGSEFPQHITKRTKHMKTLTNILCPVLTVIALTCLTLLQNAQAVNPPPDGGYPNFTTAEGTNALKSLTTGAGNTGVGWYSLFSDITGSLNTSVGAGTLVLNTGDENTATGAGALLSNTTGAENTANGAFALFSNTEGSFNTATGDQALLHNTIGTVNTAIGAGALANNTTGDHNTAIGGDFVLFSNTTGSLNTAIGVDALAANTTGNGNTAIGADALPDNITSAGNTAVGAFALSNTTGSENTAIGDEALVNNTTGGGNIVLGAFAGSGITTANNVICIGADGNNVDNSCYIGQIYGTFNTAQSAVVYIDPDGRLGTGPSARRFKKDIADMGAASEVLLSMRPVTFHFKTQDTEKAGREISQFGLIAEEVAEVNPDLILRDSQRPMKWHSPPSWLRSVLLPMRQSIREYYKYY
jgi:hypothetical protein